MLKEKEIKKAQNDLQKLWDYIRSHTSNNLWDKINKAVDLELLLEEECNQ